MKKWNWSLGAVILACLCTQGCGTVLNLSGRNYHPAHVPPPSHPQIYGGVRTSMSYVFCDRDVVEPGVPAEELSDRSLIQRMGWAGKLTLLVFIDFPASLVLDTVLLPITIPFELFSNSKPATPSAGKSKPSTPEKTR